MHAVRPLRTLLGNIGLMTLDSELDDAIGGLPLHRGVGEACAPLVLRLGLAEALLADVPGLGPSSHVHGPSWPVVSGVLCEPSLGK